MSLRLLPGRLTGAEATAAPPARTHRTGKTVVLDDLTVCSDMAVSVAHPATRVPTGRA